MKENPDTVASSAAHANAGASSSGTQTLARGLGVLIAVADGATDLREIGKALGTTRATTHRLASFLRQEGWLRQTEGRGYALGPRLIELGAIAKEQVPLAVLARPHLLRLAHFTGNTIHLGVVEGHEVLYLEKIPGTTGQEMRSRVGSRMPLACTGVGKGLMLDMPESEWQSHYERAAAVARSLAMVPPGLLDWPAYRARMLEHVRDGHAVDLEENEIGIRCVSAPIRDAGGAIVAALSVASTVPFMPLDRIAALATPVRECARDISRELGWS
jgi:DNA-binding IclR family transcriptional regulator